MNENERRGLRWSGLSDEHLALVDEDRSAGNVHRTYLLAGVRGLHIGTEQTPNHPPEAESAKCPPDQSHPNRVDRPPGTRFAAGNSGTLGSMTDLFSRQFGTGLPRVLLLHGLSSAGPVWWQIARSLAAAGYPSIAPDLRGHGESPRADRYTLDAYAADVVSSNPGPWELVIGHSLGGAIAVRAAVLDPEFALGYLLIDPALDLDSVTVTRLRSDLIAEAENPPSVAQLLSDHPAWSVGDAERKHAAVIATSPIVMSSTFDDNPDWNVDKMLSTIEARVHILGADLDPLYATNDFERHSRSGSTATFEIVPGTGHSIHRDDPDTVLDRALSLLSSQ